MSWLVGFDDPWSWFKSSSHALRNPPVLVLTLRLLDSLHTATMSEYWVSKKRYYCKYCEIYIADDVPSKQQHEGGLRHKGNKERFVRGLYKASEKKKHDLEEEKREMVRVERVRANIAQCD